jgi:hypothetical protein
VVYVLVTVMAVLLVLLLWMWWTDRLGRNPKTTVDSFHRALAAMQPDPPQGSGEEQAADAGGEQPA